MWCSAWRRAPFPDSDAYTVAYRNADGDRYSSAFTHRDADSQTQADPNSDFAAARATTCLRPRAWCAASFADRHRAWKYEPDAGRPDLRL